MSKADELAAKLRQAQRTPADTDNCADLAIEHWPGQVYELYRQVESWLAPVCEAGLVIRRNPTHVFECHSSGSTYNYAIDQLLIEGNHRRISLDPIARFSPGAEGCIEVHMKGSERGILRTVGEHGESRWHLRPTGQQRPEPVTLDEDTFLSLIEEGLGL
ncbi:hypothetical protein [Pseudomonas frederiksbergensis]|uniref:hypothetical protein n=1 Tax=Pseudomonas frederiksbergensis TaxID=104087 RepID=UPI002DBE1564|nr:hypothetical protein [Pseudomonas frederiksbergensis]WRV66556.1 hypothetical protein VQ575_16900 [Pseudomonas frederiksbergensis]